MITPDLIIRTHRKSLSLTVTKTGELVVHAPKRLSIDEIFKYIKEKEKWINSKQEEIQNRLSINKDVINYNKIQFLGKKYDVVEMKGIKKIELTSDQLIVPYQYENKILRIKQWFISNAKKILNDRIEFLSNVMQIDYAGITINNTKSRWGSCDSNRNIKLNFRLIMLPHKTLDFVLIHELAHIVEFNHSKDFYKIISLIMPNYKLQQKILKENDYLLNLYR
ncbi:MAG: M48 family metallopeptidase [Clostridia bacterium]|nr:M48 family metallopeptidase [Clostridia bacterium]